MGQIQIPQVGIGVLLKHNNKILFGKRKNSHGDGMWAPPGGHLEFKETLEDCVRREVQEETNLPVKNIQFGTITNDIFKNEDKHYVTLFMVCDYADGELKNMEPEKCEEWKWLGWDKIPRPLVLSFEHLLQKKFNPFTT